MYIKVEISHFLINTLIELQLPWLDGIESSELVKSWEGLILLSVTDISTTFTKSSFEFVKFRPRGFQNVGPWC